MVIQEKGRALVGERKVWQLDLGVGGRIFRHALGLPAHLAFAMAAMLDVAKEARCAGPAEIAASIQRLT